MMKTTHEGLQQQPGESDAEYQARLKAGVDAALERDSRMQELGEKADPKRRPIGPDRQR